jgi:long-chain acyl-CoA synthetase
LICLAEYVLVVSLFNVFPLPQKSGFRKSFAFAGQAMDRGYSVLVFPEGARTQDGEMKPFMEGIGLLVKSLGATVAPVRIDGLYELKKVRRRFARRGEITVTLGDLERFSADSEPTCITRRLENSVESLSRVI